MPSVENERTMGKQIFEVTILLIDKGSFPFCVHEKMSISYWQMISPTILTRVKALGSQACQGGGRLGEELEGVVGGGGGVRWRGRGVLKPCNTHLTHHRNQPSLV